MFPICPACLTQSHNGSVFAQDLFPWQVTGNSKNCRNWLGGGEDFPILQGMNKKPCCKCLGWQQKKKKKPQALFGSLDWTWGILTTHKTLGPLLHLLHTGESIPRARDVDLAIHRQHGHVSLHGGMVALLMYVLKTLTHGPFEKKTKKLLKGFRNILPKITRIWFVWSHHISFITLCLSWSASLFRMSQLTPSMLITYDILAPAPRNWAPGLITSMRSCKEKIAIRHMGQLHQEGNVKKKRLTNFDGS